MAAIAVNLQCCSDPVVEQPLRPVAISRLSGEDGDIERPRISIPVQVRFFVGQAAAMIPGPEPEPEAAVPDE